MNGFAFKFASFNEKRLKDFKQSLNNIKVPKDKQEQLKIGEECFTIDEIENHFGK